jgi:hypothetical protein
LLETLLLLICVVVAVAVVVDLMLLETAIPDLQVE